MTIPHLEDGQIQNRTGDGHVANVAVIHLGFLGTRHTALVSADNRGMAFSHLATRGTGVLGRVVKTTRVLGRYPNLPNPPAKLPRPSTVLAFSPLPLGNVVRATDSVGLTAMLTPYLLVIVSTTPVAQTQHKSARPKDVPAHSALTGCLAWFPAVQLKIPDPKTQSDISKSKLVYCWSNILTVLDIDEKQSEDKDQPASLKFAVRSRWKCEEAIAAVQWLSRSILIVLTISQRMIVVEDYSMRVTEAFDLLQKHIYHTDIFSAQLHNLVEQLDEDDETMHGVVADAFYMSVKAYKGRIFLLGFNEFTIGALSNWADRLIALMEHGDYLGAIQLATSYYTGDANQLTVGLPDNAALRHEMVHDKLMEIMNASLKYAFGQRQGGSHSSPEIDYKAVAEICFAACQNIGETDYLFDDVYDWYEDIELGAIFLETMEPYILEREITVIPPAVLKDLITHYVTQGWESRLEEMICHMNTSTLDLDQTTLLCKQHNLYDALIYIWNQAMGDYITPMIDLISLLVPLMEDGDNSTSYFSDEFFGVNALKLFPYLSYILTGRMYPSGESMSLETANRAKAEIYWFLFSGKTVEWPRGSKREFQTRPKERSQPSFPYLRLILKFDAPSFLSALNEIFEDSFLNDATSSEPRLTSSASGDLPEEQIFGLAINRQYVLSILLDVMNAAEFASEDTIYLDMFIARNLPKFQQYLLLSGSTLEKVLTGLCNYPGDDLAEDAQLSAEYLLSVYYPSDLSVFMLLFKRAGFYRILKRVYKSEEQFGRLLQTYLEDTEEQEQVFDCVRECLRPRSRLGKRQLVEVRRFVEQHAVELLQLDAETAASTLAQQETKLHHQILDAAIGSPELQHSYLTVLLESDLALTGQETRNDTRLVERYIKLMCRFNPSHVSAFIEAADSANLRLEELVQTLEETGTVDAAIVLMTRSGQIGNAMNRLIKHFQVLEASTVSMLSSYGDEIHNTQANDLRDLLLVLQKYVHVGIWLCQGQTQTSTSHKVGGSSQRKPEVGSNNLSPDEKLWLRLIDACVQMTTHLSPLLGVVPNDSDASATVQQDNMLELLRSFVQHTFTALLTSTSIPTVPGTSRNTPPNTSSNLSFLRILRAFLTRAASASPSLADLRGVLTSIFSAYAYEESILQLSNRLLDRSLFVNVSQSIELRQRGWRPRGSTCEACGKRVWGPGAAGSIIFGAWEEMQAREDATRAGRKEKMAEKTKNGDSDNVVGSRKGKAKDESVTAAISIHEAGDNDGNTAASYNATEPLIVLACRHIYHRSCLSALQEEQNDQLPSRTKEFRCPIDG